MFGVFEASGEIDMATAPTLAAGLRAMIDSSDAVCVSVECSEVTFMDSAGYHALADATEYARRRGHTLMIRNLSSQYARVLSLCDRARELHVERESDSQEMGEERAAAVSVEPSPVDAPMFCERVVRAHARS